MKKNEFEQLLAEIKAGKVVYWQNRSAATREDLEWLRDNVTPDPAQAPKAPAKAAVGVSSDPAAADEPAEEDKSDEYENMTKKVLLELVVSRGIVGFDKKTSNATLIEALRSDDAAAESAGTNQPAPSVSSDPAES
jgi:hypothetical protein